MLHPCQHGGREVGVALRNLFDVFHDGKGILMPMTNYAECFDRVYPRFATRVMEMADIPSDVVLLFREVWTDHRRLLQFVGHTADRWENVTSSLPQGDAISPPALNLVLLAPLCETDAAPDGHLLGLIVPLLPSVARPSCRSKTSGAPCRSG